MEQWLWGHVVSIPRSPDQNVKTDLVGITALTSEKLVLAVSQALNLTQGLIGTVSEVHL
jgi:hypothetical protein